VRHGRQAEVCDPRPPPAVDHHVGRLQIAVEDALRVGRAQPRADLPGHLDGLVPGQTADTLQQRRQILSVDVLHGEEVLAIDLGHVVDPADVGMRNLPGQPDLVEESFEAIAIRLERRRKELQRDGLAELEIVGTVDLAHSALPQEVDDPVSTGEHRAGDEAGAG